MANDSKTKKFKISELPEMLSTDISGDDLFMMSDYNDGECKSKKLNFKQLNATIAKSDEINNAVSSNIKEAAKEGGVIKPIIDEVVKEALLVLDGGNAET